MSKNNKQIITSLLALSIAFSSISNATIIEFVTSQGKVKVNLFDKTTPKTVENFLKYLDEDHYNNSVIHRVSPNFVVQGGGFEFTGTWPLTKLTPNPSIVNEPIYSNVKGTIAMAKVAGNINSATNQWFFNLKDNSKNLDIQNGGFTAFGQVISGMDIIEKIAKLNLCDNGTLVGIPVVKDSTQTCADLVAPGIDNFVVVETITIIDSSDATDANLTPTKNTLNNTKPSTPKESSGGSFGWLALLAIGFTASYRRLLKKDKLRSI